jgi:hypothetical protein
MGHDIIPANSSNHYFFGGETTSTLRAIAEKIRAEVDRRAPVSASWRKTRPLTFVALSADGSAFQASSWLLIARILDERNWHKSKSNIAFDWR